MKVIQRNCACYLKLKNWQWWRLFTKVTRINITALSPNIRCLSKSEENTNTKKAPGEYQAPS